MTYLLKVESWPLRKASSAFMMSSVPKWWLQRFFYPEEYIVFRGCQIMSIWWMLIQLEPIFIDGSHGNSGLVSRKAHLLLAFPALSP